MYGRCDQRTSRQSRQSRRRLSRSSPTANDIVGHVQLSRGWIDARSALLEVLVLSPLSVSPPWQRRGIGTQLIAAALAEEERQTFPAVFLEGSPTYYGKRGFRAAGKCGFRRPSARIPEPAFQVALLPGHEPWMVGQFVYPDAFSGD